MADVIYTQTSPYYQTLLASNGNYLDTWQPPTVPASPSDSSIVINQTYNLRPDLLAHDLYGDSRLWWVFAMRNPNSLRDPFGDFVTGTRIYLPDAASLQSALGL